MVLTFSLKVGKCCGVVTDILKNTILLIVLVFRIRGWSLGFLGWLETNDRNKICGYQIICLKKCPRFGREVGAGLGEIILGTQNNQ